MNKYKDFSEEIWNEIYKKIDLATQKPGPHYAAFDADGTLWDNDAGNAFFDFQINNKLVPLPTNAWEEIYRLKRIDPKVCFLWMAQINKGVPLETVRNWARTCYQQHTGFDFYPSIKKLINYLQSKNVQVFVVTASVKWAVEPYVESLGIKADDVVGIKTKIVDGIITDEQDGAITYKEGKATALLEKTQGIHPLLVAGNTMGDFYMLELAQEIKLALRSVNDNQAFKEKDLSLQEMELFQAAKSRGWLTHNFGK